MVNHLKTSLSSLQGNELRGLSFIINIVLLVLSLSFLSPLFMSFDIKATKFVCPLLLVRNHAQESSQLYVILYTIPVPTGDFEGQEIMSISIPHHLIIVHADLCL